MIHVLRKLIGNFVLVYFDDILIYCRNDNEHMEHLKKAFEVFRQQKLFGNLKKCQLYQDWVIFLVLVILQHRVEVDKEKVKTIKEWLILTIVSKVKKLSWLSFIL